jgi:hypothetical protein
VTPPPVEPQVEAGPGESGAGAGPTAVPDAEEGPVSRISFRLPDQLKSRIEEAAGREGLSVNAWLVRAATAAVQATPPTRPATRAPRGGQRYTGWVR